MTDCFARQIRKVFRWFVCLSRVVELNLSNLASVLHYTVPHSVVTPNHKVISLLLNNRNLVTVMNHNVNSCYSEYVICDPSDKVVWDPKVENRPSGAKLQWMDAWCLGGPAPYMCQSLIMPLPSFTGK